MKADNGPDTGWGMGFLATWTSRRLLPAALLAVAVVFLLPLRTGAQQGNEPHAHFQKPEFCPMCHVLVEGKPSADRFLRNADDFCLGCHRNEEGGRSHPRNVRPNDRNARTKIQGRYPLDDNGRIMCLTCHKGHGAFLSAVKVFPAQKPEAGRGSGGMQGYKTFYLRRSDPERGIAPLCSGCHPSL